MKNDSHYLYKLILLAARELLLVLVLIVNLIHIINGDFFDEYLRAYCIGIIVVQIVFQQIVWSMQLASVQEYYLPNEQDYCLENMTPQQS